MMKKLYILDDDRDFLDIATHILQKNYELAPATAFRAEEVQAFKPDLILMDNAIGDLTSAFVISQLYELIPFFSTPVILVSAHPNIAILAANKGVFGYIQKPASVREIREQVAFFLDKIDKKTA